MRNELLTVFLPSSFWLFLALLGTHMYTQPHLLGQKMSHHALLWKIHIHLGLVLPNLSNCRASSPCSQYIAAAALPLLAVGLVISTFIETAVKSHDRTYLPR